MKKTIHTIDNIMISDKGFTLIEILISMLVLSLGLMTMAVMQSSAVKSNYNSNKLTELSTCASRHLEILLALPLNDPSLIEDSDSTTPENDAHDFDNDGVDNDGDGMVDNSSDDGEPGYSVTWLVTDDSANRKSISLTVIQNATGKRVTVNTVRLN